MKILHTISPLALTIIILLSACQEDFEYQTSPTPDPNVGVDIMTFLENHEYFDSLSIAIDRAGLRNTYSDPNANVTIWALDDFNFGSFTGEKSLDDFTSEELADFVKGHTLRGTLIAPEGFPAFPNQVSLETLLSGKTINIRQDDRNRVYANDNRSPTSNIRATNGVVHVIARAL